MSEIYPQNLSKLKEWSKITISLHMNNANRIMWIIETRGIFTIVIIIGWKLGLQSPENICHFYGFLYTKCRVILCTLTFVGTGIKESPLK